MEMTNYIYVVDRNLHVIYKKSINSKFDKFPK